jgi:O-antigen ligase
VLLGQAQTRKSASPLTLVDKAAIGIAVNATLVHFLISSTPAISLNNYVELLKYVLLYFLITRAIQDRTDFRVVVLAMAVGAAYIGYEVTINERGDFTGSRLEGVGAPGADTSNSLASVLLLTLPVIGSLMVNGRFRDKVFAIMAAPFVLNVVLLCNSRGAFLGLIGAGAMFVALSRGAARKQALRAVALGGILLFLLLGDPEILQRFLTTFSGSEDRDRSAASRLEFWQAGLLMIADYPLGDGGGSFKFVHGGAYLARVVGKDAPERSLHNGYLTEATEWGLQGLTLRLIFIGGAMLAAYRTIKRCYEEGRPQDSLVGNCLIAAIVSFLTTSVFGSFISNEWSYWIVALLIGYCQTYAVPARAVDPVHSPARSSLALPQLATADRSDAR